jgi:hypothetical protein
MADAATAPDETDDWAQLMASAASGGGSSGGASGGASSSGGDSGPGFFSRLQGLLGDVGNVVGGGDPGLANLTPAQHQQAGGRALLNFGLGMLAASDYSFQPHTFGHALAAGLQSAEQSRQASDEAAYTAAGQAFNQRLALEKLGLNREQIRELAAYHQAEIAHALGQLDVSRGQLAVSQQEAALKAGGLALQTRMFNQKAAILNALTGGRYGSTLGAGGGAGGQDGAGAPAGGGSGAGAGGAGGASGASGGGAGIGKGAGLSDDYMQDLKGNPVYASLPAPSSSAAAGVTGFKDPGLADAIYTEATRQGVDPKLALAVAYHESAGDPNVRTGDGGLAVGPFQVHPDAAMSAGYKPEDRTDLTKNVAMGVSLLKNSINKYGPVGGIAGYRLPVDAQAASQGKPMSPATRQYTSDVLGLMAQMPGDTGRPYQTASLAPVPPPSSSGPAPTPASPPTPPPGAPPGAPQIGPAYPGGGGRGTASPAQQPFAGVGEPLDPDLQEAHDRAMLGEGAKDSPDYGGVEKGFRELQDKRNAATWRAATPEEVISKFGQNGFNPRTIYQVNRLGEFKATAQNDPIQENMAKMAADTFQNEYAKPRAEANDRLNALNQLSVLNRMIGDGSLGSGGPLSEVTAKLQTLGNSLGIKVDTTKLGAVDAYNALVNGLILNLKPSTVSRLTNMDIGMLQEMAPTLQTTPQGRRMILQMLTQGAQRTIDQGHLAEETFYKPGPSYGTLYGLQDKIDAMGPVFKQLSPSMSESQFRAMRDSIKPGEVYINAYGKPMIRGQEPPPPAAVTPR